MFVPLHKEQVTQENEKFFRRAFRCSAITTRPAVVRTGRRGWRTLKTKLKD